MRIRKFINLILIILCICLIADVGAFIYNAKTAYKISSDFVSVPLKFNHADSSSTYNMDNAQVTVYDGFVKNFKTGGKVKNSLIYIFSHMILIFKEW